MHVPPKTLEDLGWASIREELARSCGTDRGSERARAIAPLDDLALAEQRGLEALDARRLLEADLAIGMGGVVDVVTACRHAAKQGLLEPQALLAIASTLRAAARLKEQLHEQAELAPHLVAHGERLVRLEHVYRPLEESFDAGGQLRDDASAALGPLRRKHAAVKEELARSLRSMLDDPDLAPALQDRFHTEREGRYVLPVRADARSRIGGIVHGASQSGATYYVEPPALVDQNNRLTLTRMDVEQEERRILAQLSGLVGEFIGPIEQNLDVLEHLDVTAAAALLSRKLGATRAVLQGVTETQLLELRHPLLILAKGIEQVVPNDLVIGRGRALVISGPNAGGKTVAMKSLGMALLLARAGLHVPARPDPLVGAAQIVPYQTLLTDVGDDQSLERDLSTFSAHLTHLVEFVARADGDALLLLDELAVGTDPEQGAALAQAVLEALVERGGTVVVTTHYDRLKALAATDERFANAAVGFALDRLSPTYRLHVGVPGPSYALEIARRLRLPSSIVERAQALGAHGRRDLEQLLVRVTAEREELAEARLLADRARAEAEAARREAEMRARSLRDRERELHKGAATEAIAALQQARSELIEVTRTLRRNKGTVDLEEAKERVAATAQTIATHGGPIAADEEGRPARPEELVVGATVQVPRLGGTAVVEAAPEKGKVTVRIGALRSQVKVDEVRIGARKAVATTKPRDSWPGQADRAKQLARAAPDARDARVDGGRGSGAVRTPANTCDLRGMRVEEAIAEAERFVDLALRQGEPAIFLLHGHGTGALRQAIRSWCDQSGAIQSARPGENNEGGDGITVALLA